MSGIGTACCNPRSNRAETRVPDESHGHAKVECGTTSNLFAAMVAIAAGEFDMGSQPGEGYPQDGESPVRRVAVNAFEIDRFPVTNDDFGRFVQDTGYRTEAERFGWSFVFWAHVPRERFQILVQDTVAGAEWWCKVADAWWRAPEGPGSNIDGRGTHPVVHVSWNDAMAFASWCGKRLPTEAEWEFAARGGLAKKRYTWGDELLPDGKHQCNIWQGKFPVEDTAEDGFAGTCPVDAFPANGFGLYSMAGNTWEWCADWFSGAREHEGERKQAGPETGSPRVMKGGSFLCHASYCNRYRVAARTSNTPDSSTSNIGFRCARDTVSSIDRVAVRWPSGSR
jgi:sulfatase modifying factor 1